MKTGKWMRRASFITLLVLAGCSTERVGVNTEADVGPVPQKYEQTIHDYLTRTLKDPYTAHVRIGTIEKASCSMGIWGTHWGWRVPVAVNAKNSYGAYVGEQTEFYWLTSAGQVERVSPNITFCGLDSLVPYEQKG